MPSNEDIQSSSDSSDEEASTAQSTTSTTSSQRGLSLEDKRKFLQDIDDAGGFDSLSLDALVQDNPSFYGSVGTAAGLARRKQFQNLHYQWSKKFRTGTFGKVRKSLKQGFTSPSTSRPTGRPANKVSFVPKEKTGTPSSNKQSTTPRSNIGKTTMTFKDSKDWLGSLFDASDDEDGKFGVRCTFDTRAFFLTPLLRFLYFR